MMQVTTCNGEKSAKTFEEAISLTGFGKFNLFTLITTGGCLMCVIIETMCAMFITPAAQCDLNLSLAEKGALYSISFFGVVSSSHIWGFLADTKGRKIVTLLSLISSAIVSFIGSFVTIPWLFILLRFVNGFLIGGSSAIIYAFAGEFHDNRYRPKVVSWIAAFVAFGNIYLPGLAWAVLPQEWTYDIPFLNLIFRPWRLLMIIYALPSIFFGILVCFLPESPKYLLSQGQHDQALNILEKIYQINSGKQIDKYPVSAIIWTETHDVQHQKHENIFISMWNQTVPLFQETYRLKTLMVCFCQFCVFLTTSAVIMWLPQMLNSMSEYGKIVPQEEVTMCKSILYDDDDDDKVEIMNYTSRISSKSLVSKLCTDTVDEQVFLASIILGCCYAVVYTFIGTVINVVGPKRLLIGFMTMGTISGICAQFVSGYSYVQIALVIFLMAGPCVGIINAIVVELYPTQIRGMALAVSLMFGRFGAMTGSNVAGPVMSTYCDYMFYVCAGIHIVIVIVILLLKSNTALAITTNKIQSRIL